jgi:hypothetical protein
MGVARHGRLKRSHPFVNVLKLVAIALTVAVVGTVAVAAIAVLNFSHCR